MPIDRPTFSESWYRVANLRPRLRSTVQVHRQHFRGELWHVLQDPASNQFFRLNEPAYRFVAALDGRRTVAEVWALTNDSLADDAPTQGEAIQLLGQLYSSNLLQAELPPDAEGLFQRYRKRIRREVQSYLMNLLFVRIPVLDPDHFLDRWVALFGRLFTWPALVLWLLLVLVGSSVVLAHFGELTNQASALFGEQNLARNLLWLYIAFVLVKVLHEFSHAFAAKKFGRDSHTGGEVHVMGVMFLVFTPLPYVDASSAWALRSKFHRAVVGAAGILTELALASVAALVWVNTSANTLPHDLAYKVIFIAGVGTVLFNGNPLLRYDGYYILSDLLEIPNLAQRAKDYLYYLVKRYVWSVRQARSSAHTPGERPWLLFYAVASTVFRVYISVRILLFIADKLFILGAILAVAALIAWVCVPAAKFLRYLATSGELARVRSRAVFTTLAAFLLLFTAVGLIPVSDRSLVEGVVEPVHLAIVHAAADGFVSDVLPSGSAVSSAGPVLITASNPELLARKEMLLAQVRSIAARRRLAQTKDVAAAQALADQLRALQEQLDRVDDQLRSLNLLAPLAGTWVSPDVDRFKGAFLHRGDTVGLVASLDDTLIRATVPLDIARVLERADSSVRIRLKGNLDPALEFTGSVQRILPAGLDELPSAALGYAASGPIAVDPQTKKTLEHFFEIRIIPQPNPPVTLLSGERVLVRFSMPPRPLLSQWYRSVLQLIQRRFHA